MQDASRPNAIVFDLDGTLVDTVGARIAAWERAFAEDGVRVERGQLEPLIGMDGRRLAAEVLRAAGEDANPDRAEALDRRAGARFDELNRDPQPLPGARALLARLHEAGMTWAIATSSRAEQVTASVAALRLEGPPRIVDGSRVADAKPAPDLLLLAARQLGAPVESCWYVGDSTWDMRAAVAAGMRAIAVTAGAAVGPALLREAGADLVLPTLEQLEPTA